MLSNEQYVAIDIKLNDGANNHVSSLAMTRFEVSGIAFVFRKTNPITINKNNVETGNNVAKKDSYIVTPIIKKADKSAVWCG